MGFAFFQKNDWQQRYRHVPSKLTDEYKRKLITFKEGAVRYFHGFLRMDSLIK